MLCARDCWRYFGPVLDSDKCGDVLADAVLPVMLGRWLCMFTLWAIADALVRLSPGLYGFQTGAVSGEGGLFVEYPPACTCTYPSLTVGYVVGWRMHHRHWLASSGALTAFLPSTLDMFAESIDSEDLCVVRCGSRVDVTDVGVDCTWNGFSALEVLFRPGAVSFTFGTWRLEGHDGVVGRWKLFLAASLRVWMNSSLLCSWPVDASSILCVREFVD